MDFTGVAAFCVISAFATSGSPRVCGPQILVRAPGWTNLGDPVSPTTTVTLRMIYFITTGETMFILQLTAYSSTTVIVLEVQKFT